MQSQDNFGARFRLPKDRVCDSSALSDVEPEDEEDEEAEEEQVVDVIVAVRLQQLPHLPYRVGDDGTGAVELVVHVLEQLVLLLQLHPNVDGEGLELRYLVLHVAFHLLVLILEGLVAHDRPLGVAGNPRASVRCHCLQTS